MVVDGMYGLGDNIYQRAILREVKERVFLKTTWPQLYTDIPNIRCVVAKTRLRTQRKNVARLGANTWCTAPSSPSVKLSYGSRDLREGTILKSLSKPLSVKPKIFDLPKFKGLDIDKKYAVIRPVTIRSEWYNKARGPEDKYILKASQLLRELGFFVISVADIVEKEWCALLPEADVKYNKGELCFEQLMGLIQNAALVVGGVGWIVPACIASKVNLITILGGQGGHNAPSKIIDHPMKIDKAKFIFPDNYCMCTDNRHVCNKTITHFEAEFINAVKELN